MKKVFIALVAAAALMLASCKSTDYIGLIEQEIDNYTALQESIVNDETLAPEEKVAKIEEAIDVLKENLGRLTDECLTEHPADTLGVEMVKIAYQLDLTDGEGVLKMIERLDPKMQKNADIEKIKGLVESEMNPAYAEGAMFADFEVVQPDGSVMKLSDFAGKGKYCLVDFWASWCGPCKREIPNLKDIYEKYGKKGLEMVSVAVWDEPQASIDTAAEYGITWNHIVNAQQIPTEIYGIQGIPHIMLIGPDGVIIKRDLRGEQIGKVVAEYIK